MYFSFPESDRIGCEGTICTSGRTKRNTHVKAVSILIIHVRQQFFFTSCDLHAHIDFFFTGKISLTHEVLDIFFLPAFIQSGQGNLGRTDTGQRSPRKHFSGTLGTEIVKFFFNRCFRCKTVLVIQRECGLRLNLSIVDHLQCKGFVRVSSFYIKCYIVLLFVSKGLTRIKCHQQFTDVLLI